MAVGIPVPDDFAYDRQVRDGIAPQSNAYHDDLYPRSRREQPDNNRIPSTLKLQRLLSRLQNRQQNARHQHKQRLCRCGDEEPPFLPMRIVGEAQTKTGKDETAGEEATEGDGGEAELTSGWVKAGEDDG
jgi:hypothetical protein